LTEGLADEIALRRTVYGACRAGGKRLEDNAVLTAHIHDGKVTEVWVQPTDPYAFDEFWS
jgi:hypothetical protein